MQKLFLLLMTCVLLTSGGVLVHAADKSVKAAKLQAKKANKKVKAPKAGKKKPTAKKKKAKKPRAAKRASTSKAQSKEGPLPETATLAIKDLSRRDPDVVIEAIQVLGITGHPDAVPPLLELLSKGPRSDITDAILYALATLHHEDVPNALLGYLKHRRADARIAAIRALTGYPTKTVTSALEGALADSDRQVRSAAAIALGKRGDKSSVPVLFLAFERGVAKAATAIGQLGEEQDSKRLTRYLGKEDIKVLLAGFDEFLKRDEISESAKLNILNRLFDLAGPEVWRFAVTYKATFPPDTDENENRIYKLVCRMVRQIKDK